MHFQRIYEKALAEPAIGYEASSKFERAIFNCPKCKGIVWTRLQRNTKRPLGFRCPTCGWISTFLSDPNPKKEPEQLKLFP